MQKVEKKFGKWVRIIYFEDRVILIKPYMKEFLSYVFYYHHLMKNKIVMMNQFSLLRNVKKVPILIHYHVKC